MHHPRIWKLGAAISALVLACSAGEPAAPTPEQPAGSQSPPPAEAAASPDIATATAATDAAPPGESTAGVNQPPEWTGLEIDGQELARGDRDLIARPQAEDPDGDAIAFEYRWSVNGQHVASAGEMLSHAHFARGDRINLSARAADGASSSEWRRTDPFEIGNVSPRITSIPGDFDPDGTFRYPIDVEDSDGDRGYRYEMRKGPAGMQIDSVTGTVLWTPTSDQGGTHPVTIAVSDRHGGTAVQDFDVRVAFEDFTPPAAPQP
jgi:hypothetical protein